MDKVVELKHIKKFIINLNKTGGKNNGKKKKTNSLADARKECYEV